MLQMMQKKIIAEGEKEKEPFCPLRPTRPQWLKVDPQYFVEARLAPDRLLAPVAMPSHPQVCRPDASISPHACLQAICLPGSQGEGSSRLLAPNTS